jgi:sulfide:quinone oxidoreductase
VARVAVIGAGPGGISAARRLKDRAADEVEVILFERESHVEYLPGTIPIFLGKTPRERWRETLSLENVELRFGEVEEVSGSGVVVDGETCEADIVVAAPGLALDEARVPDAPNIQAFWDPAGAEAAARTMNDFRGETIAIIISSLPYRCPPAPFGMAMDLASLQRGARRETKVMLTTPEETPLAAVGGGVPAFLERSCAEAGVEIFKGFEPDLDRFEYGEVRSMDNLTLEYDLAFVIPPHVRSPLLAELPGKGPLVPVSSRFESEVPGLFVIGDAAMVPLPRAADAAAAEGITAADAILERLGLSDASEPHMPEPECYVGHGDGSYSRISLRYPDGLPPLGEAEVEIQGPSEMLATGIDEAFDRWQRMRTG